jgi:hypothetical protein
MAKMADADLRELVKRRRDASAKYLNDNHSRDRKEALSFYRGENDTVYGDSGDGLSTVVSRDTYEAIESILPGLIKPFVAGEEAVSFDPRGPEDEEGAKQATEYINYRFTNDNSAFRVVYDYAKDGLLYRLGVAKVVHEEVEETTVDTYADLSDEEFAALESLIADVEGAEILDDPERDENGITARVKMSGTRPTYRVHIVAPEEFLHEDRLASLEDATFLAHRKNVAVGDLIAMGLPKNKCMKLQGLEPETGEADQRHGFDEFREQFDDNDLARQVTVTDAHVRCDYDGSGTLQWRRVILGGTEDTLLHEEPVEDHPFVPWTPIPIPHKLVGLSIHDATRDIQMQATAVTREMLNALYLSNRPQREVVEGQVNLEDLMTPTVGGVVRVKAPNMVREIESGGEGVMQQSMGMLEHLATIREQRTGSTRYNQGMDANSLNKTATGISIIQNASTQRLEVIARQLAEAMEQIFKKMLALVTRHADRKEVIRLRGEWVEMDPRSFSEYDTIVSVGLGTGNKEQMAAHLTNLMNIQKEIGSAQGNLDGPIVKWENIYEAAKRLTENLGLKGVERYFNDPKNEQPAEAATEAQQAPPDPNDDPTVIKARIDADAKVEVAKIDAEKDVIIAGLSVPPGLMPHEVSEMPEEAAEPMNGMEMPPPPEMALSGPEIGGEGAFEQ